MVTCLLIYFCCPWLSTVGTSRHPGSSPSSSLLLLPGSAAEVAPGAAVTRPQLGTDAGQGCSSSPRLEAGPGRSPRPGVGHAALGELQRRGPSSPRRLPRSLAWGQWPVPSQPEQGSAGESCSPGGRARSGRLSPLLPALGRAGGAALAPHPRHGRAGTSEPVGRGARGERGSSLGNKAMFTSDSSGLAAGSRAVAQRDPGGDIQRGPRDGLWPAVPLLLGRF